MDNETTNEVLDLLKQEDIKLNINYLINFHTIEEAEVPSYSTTLIQKKIGITQTPQGVPICNVNNALKILEGCEGLKEAIWFDEFHQKIFTTWKTGVKREWTDSETIALLVVMQRYIGLFRLSKEAVFDAVFAYANHFRKNELKEWLDSLTWDQTPRMEQLFSKYFGADSNDYVKAVSKNSLISMVARVFEPGCKADHMPVIEGPQGSFKSTGIEALVGEGYYCDAHESVTSKDFFQIFQGKWLIEIAELDAFSRAEVTRVKQIITCKNDRYRASYGRLAEDHPRKCIFIGTTNEDTYLRDSTGARRFWPIKSGYIDISLIKADREQLFAEAVHCYKSGVPWWIMPDTAVEEQEARRQTDAWEEIVEKYLNGKSECTLTDVALNCLNFSASNFGKSEQMRLAGTLKAIGWKKDTIWRGGKSLKGWLAPKAINIDELLPATGWEN